MGKTEIIDKVKGCLIGGAVGDALGYPVEFIFSYDDISRKYGEGGIKDYDRITEWHLSDDDENKAQFSDDTQMTLYTAEGLLYATEHDTPIVETITDSYLYWLGPQIGRDIKGSYPSELIDIDELNQDRAPGNTCISALMSISEGRQPANNSKGCGGIMRIAPIALYGATHDWTPEQTARLAGEIAEITHKHKLSTLASACAAVIIEQCVKLDVNCSTDVFERIVSQALDCVSKIYSDSECLDDFNKLICKAMELSGSPLEDWQVIEQALGGGWVAEETLAIALFSVARHLDSFEDCMVCAVNHGGDSDSTGAVAGNILGAILGINAIPARFRNNLQLYSLLDKIAKKLAD